MAIQPFRICEYESCTGCEICKISCPTNAISMELDKKGFFFPVINYSTCIDCSKCIKKCPANKKFDIINNDMGVYAGWAKDKTIRNESSSGGIFSVLAIEVINKGGIVFGAKWDNSFTVVFDYATTIEELKEFRGSKYVQAKIGDCYKQAKDFLDAGRTVLFSGTPCYIAGLNSFLNKDYENLITVDLICHGVPSPKVFESWIQEIENTEGQKLEKIKFRYKNPDWLQHAVKYSFKNNQSHIIHNFKDLYYRGFDSNFYLRESCYHCRYTSISRVSDITLADFWRYSPTKIKFHNYKKGLSLIIINSNKGYQLFSDISSKIVFEENAIERAINGNPSLQRPQSKPEQFDNFWKDYFSGVEFGKLASKYFPPRKIIKLTLKNKCRMWLNILLPYNH